MRPMIKKLKQIKRKINFLNNFFINYSVICSDIKTNLKIIIQTNTNPMNISSKLSTN